MNADPDRQIPLLSIGFRPFFLAAGLYAIAAMLAWIGWLGIHYINAAVVTPSIAIPAHLWHGHEMLFGFAGAVISGFMLTAVPGWTGARRVAGAPLAILVLVWLAGRGVMWFSSFLSPGLVAAVEMLHLPLLAITIGLALARHVQPRNLIFLVLVMILIAANAAFHAQWIGWHDDTASWALAIAAIAIILMIVILGGRIVPSFTRNAMIRRGEGNRLPSRHPAIDRVAIASVAAYLICVALVVPEVFAGVAALVAAASNLFRQIFWRPGATLAEPILWSLHLSYLWIPVGFAAMAVAGLTGAISQGAALHVLMVGAIGGMTLAMMTRAPLGHTGRPLTVRTTVALAYLMVAGAAVLRGFILDATATYYFETAFLAGALWISGFALFTLVYVPILIGPSLKAAALD